MNTNNLMDGLAWLKANNHLYAGIKIPVFPSEESTPPVIEINCDSRKLRHDENIRNDGWLPETSVTEKDSVLPQVNFVKYIKDKNAMPVYDIQRNRNSPINICFLMIMWNRWLFQHFFQRGSMDYGLPENK